MLLVTLLLLADVLAALVVGFMVVLCDVGVLGECVRGPVWFGSGGPCAVQSLSRRSLKPALSGPTEVAREVET